jgi:hypothetical protein
MHHAKADGDQYTGHMGGVKLFPFLPDLSRGSIPHLNTPVNTPLGRFSCAIRKFALMK